MSIASLAAQQSSSTASASTAAAGNSANALNSLTSNFNAFLSLLTTQLKNQDPSSPMDANQFTTELVQFAGVEQQINTNNGLNQLVSLTQAGEILQTSSIVGKQVVAQSAQMPLQSGQGGLQFTSTAATATEISITDNAGATVLHATVPAAAGTNQWSWNGQDSNGRQMPDGAYNVKVTQPSTGSSASIPFAVIGTATGVQKSGTAVDLQMGKVSVDFSTIQSVQ